MSTDQMIKEADVIAIVNIGTVEKTDSKSGTLNYHQAAKTVVEQILKGTPAKTFTIYGGINTNGFVACVPDVSLKSARSLVFLRQRSAKESDAFISANGDHGIRPITDGQVEWPNEHANTPAQNKLKLSEVITKIKKVLPPG